MNASPDKTRSGFFMRLGLAAFAMFGVGLTTARIEPARTTAPVAPMLDQMIPDDFGDWRRVELHAAVLPAETEKGPGEAVLYRAYRDALGRVVTLVVAYGPPLGDSVRLHRPESCYVAQGFRIEKRETATVDLGGEPVALVQLKTHNPVRSEAVTYWLRSGAGYVTSAPAQQFARFTVQRSSRADGVLVRVSTSGLGVLADEIHGRFLQDFAGALSPEARRLLMVTPGESNPHVDT